MATIEDVEDKIRKVEGFDVRFMYDGKDVRGDKKDVPEYKFERKADDDSNVRQWIENRFKAVYNSLEYEVKVLDGDGKPVHGRTTLENVRKSYL